MVFLEAIGMSYTFFLTLMIEKILQHTQLDFMVCLFIISKKQLEIP